VKAKKKFLEKENQKNDKQTASATTKFVSVENGIQIAKKYRAKKHADTVRSFFNYTKKQKVWIYTLNRR